MFRIILLSFILFSCSANYHLNKAIKKGAKLKEIEVIKYDTTYFSDHYYRVDTVFNKEMLVEYVPETRWKTRIETRFEHKRFKDSLRASQKRFNDTLRLVRYNLSLENKRALKELKIEKNKNNRLNRILWWAMAFFIILLIIYILGKTLANKLFK